MSSARTERRKPSVRRQRTETLDPSPAIRRSLCRSNSASAVGFVRPFQRQHTWITVVEECMWYPGALIGHLEHPLCLEARQNYTGRREETDAVQLGEKNTGAAPFPAGAPINAPESSANSEGLSAMPTESRKKRRSTYYGSPFVLE